MLTFVRPRSLPGSRVPSWEEQYGDPASGQADAGQGERRILLFASFLSWSCLCIRSARGLEIACPHEHKACAGWWEVHLALGACSVLGAEASISVSGPRLGTKQAGFIGQGRHEMHKRKGCGKASFLLSGANCSFQTKGNGS